MSPEHKEIAIWAGGAAAVVIAGWIVLAGRGATIAEVGTRVDAAHATYEELYLAAGDDRLPAQEAIDVLEQRRDEQAGELDAVEERLVWPGTGRGVPPEFAGFQFGPDAGKLTNYATALDLVSRVTARLRRRGDSLGIQLPGTLPYEGAGELSNDDDARRNLQLAQVCAYAALVDLALDAVVTKVGPIEPGSGWVDATGTYAIIPATSVLECSYESADAMLRQLRDNGWGLGVERTVLDFQDDGSFRFTLGLHLVVPNDEAWELGDAPQAGGPATTRGDDGGRAGRRGRRGTR